MSDFFGDDFTAELKEYFLRQLLTEVNKYQAAADADSWAVFRDEILEKSDEWILDGRTNEFSFFAKWFEGICAELQRSDDYDFFQSFLSQTELYLQKLLETKKDSEETSSQYRVALSQNHSKLYLHCQIEEQEIILPVQHVLEVVGNKSLSRLPRPINGICGMLPYRGEALPVFSFCSAAEETAAPQSFSYVICKLDQLQFALQVTGVDQLFEISAQELQKKGEGELFFAAKFISHFVLRDNKHLMLFDLQRLVAA